MPTILLARHAQAAYGTSDYDRLSAHGREQVALLDAELQRRGQRLARVVSGSLRRQRDTAMPIAARAGLTVETDPRLDEFDADDVLASHSAATVRLEPEPGEAAPSPRDFQDVLDGALERWIGAGRASPARESWDEFSARSNASLTELAGAMERGTTALVSTSGGVIAAVCVRLLDVPHSSFPTLNRVVVNASLGKVVAGRRGLTMVTFNDHAHLEGEERSLVTYR